MIYAQCPRRYYYRYLLRVPEIPFFGNQQNNKKSSLDPLHRGNIVHRVCEHLRTDSHIDQLLEWAISMEGLTLVRDESDTKVVSKNILIVSIIIEVLVKRWNTR